MKLRIRLAVVAVVPPYSQEMPSRSPQLDGWRTIQPMSAVLEYSNVVTQKHSGVSEDGKGPCRRVHLELFGCQDARLCCDGLARVARAGTDGNGRFNFKKTPASAYRAVKGSGADCHSFYSDLNET